MTKTVFFGPFIGELGWELLYWQGWVRRVCQEEFRDYRKIAASFPGREPFYPYVDEFWALPDEFLALQTSGHAYLTDGWRAGYPGLQREILTRRTLLSAIRYRHRPAKEWVMEPLDSPDVEPEAERMLRAFATRLPPDTTYIVPWRLNHYPAHDLTFGIELPPDAPAKAPHFQPHIIPLHVQRKEYITPTAEAFPAVDALLGSGRRVIALLPRRRRTRRPDKNWPVDHYLALIEGLQKAHPESLIAVIGEPGGAYFDDGVPDGCVDLINIDPRRRLNIQVAALQRSHFCIGGMSGALSFAMATGCPAVMWGFDFHLHTYTWANFMCTPFVYHQNISPRVDEILRLADAFCRMIASHSRSFSAA